ncbi:glycosyltransferase family 4 protein [Tenacibaculum sp. MEBiC06402]|uniref:glycosyltransferase family 4 protein n=1 Tax=unclassified Tenacibaculum TaxID=2635139 RepID=UPI003B9C5729
MTKEQIIIITPYRNSFIDNDIEIFSTEFHVVINDYNWKRKSLYPIFAIRQLFFLLKNIRKTKKILIEFGGYWAVLPTLLGKIFKVPTAIVLHGTDCAVITHINYGSMRKSLVKKVCGFSYRQASILLPVSDSLIHTESKYTLQENVQGIKHYFPNLKTPHKVIYNGLDIKFWRRLKEINKEEKRFLAVFSESQFIHKGGDLIIAVAKKFTDCKFYIAGCENIGFNNVPKNVQFLGRLSNKELLNEYNKSQYYFQLSIFEGFGLSLCEAMLCECIPIVSSVNILPKIIGDSGYVLEKNDSYQLEKIICKAIENTNKNQFGAKAKNRIVENFSLEKRANELINTLRSL